MKEKGSKPILLKLPPVAWLLIWNEFARITRNFAFVSNVSSKRDEEGNLWLARSDKQKGEIVLICDVGKSAVEKAQATVDRLEREIESLASRLQKIESHIAIFAGQPAMVAQYESERALYAKELAEKTRTFQEAYTRLLEGKRKTYKFKVSDLEDFGASIRPSLEVEKMPFRNPAPLPERALLLLKEKPEKPAEEEPTPNIRDAEKAVEDLEEVVV